MISLSTVFYYYGITINHSFVDFDVLHYTMNNSLLLIRDNSQKFARLHIVTDFFAT